MVFHADLRVIYLAAALPALAVYLAAVLWLRRLVEQRGRSQLIGAGLVAALVVNTAVVRALHWGHPEEMMCAGLLLCAALAAPRSRWQVTAILLGLALATKPWAALGVLPVLCAAPRARVPIAAVAAAVAAVLTLPFVIEAPHRLAAIAGAVSNPQRFWAGQEDLDGKTRVSAATLAWPLAERRQEFRSGLHVRSALVPEWVVSLSHALIALLVLPLVWRAARNPRVGPDRWLGVLAAVFLLRCLLEPVNFDYYHVAALLFLGAWEGLARRGMPVLTLIAVTGLGVTFSATESSLAGLYRHALSMNVTYLAWMVPLTAYVLWAQFSRAASLSYAGNVRNSGSSSASAVATNSA